MENFILVALTSSVVAGLVTLILGHLFESRRYLKDKKLAVYSEYINKLNALLYPKKNEEDITVRFFRALAELERLSWNVILLSNNKDLKDIAKLIVSNYRKILLGSHMKERLTNEERKQLKEVGSQQEKNREEFIKLANKDVNSWF